MFCDSNRATNLLLRYVIRKLNKMERKMSDLSDAVSSVLSGLADLDPKIDTIVAGVAALEAALANAGQVPPDVAQAVTDLKAAAADIATQSTKVAAAAATLPQPAPAPAPAPSA